MNGDGAKLPGVRGKARVAGGGVTGLGAGEDVAREVRPNRSSSLATKLQRKRTASAVGSAAASIAILLECVGMPPKQASPLSPKAPAAEAVLVSELGNCDISPARSALSNSLRSMSPSLFVSMRSKMFVLREAWSAYQALVLPLPLPAGTLEDAS
jgi:hypothetical protein